MKILIVAEHYAVCSGRYMTDALRRLGHDVRHIGPNRGHIIWGMAIDERYTWLADLPEKGWKADLVIFADAHMENKKFGDCPHVVYGVDNHVRDYRQYSADHLFLAHGHGARMGEPNVSWLPCAYDPTVFQPSPVPWAARTYDVAHIGVMYDTRAELIYGLHNQGLSIAFGTGAVYDQYAAVYQNARISLVKSAHNDAAIRLWETAAMGCLLVMDAVADCEALGLQDGINCLMYSTPQEAAQQVKRALANPQWAMNIAAEGQAWALPGTWDARMQVIVEWALAQSAGDREKVVKS